MSRRPVSVGVHCGAAVTFLIPVLTHSHPLITDRTQKLKDARSEAAKEIEEAFGLINSFDDLSGVFVGMEIHRKVHDVVESKSLDVQICVLVDSALEVAFDT